MTGTARPPRKPTRFGYFLTPDAANPDEVVRLALLADDLGLDLLGIQDILTRALSWTPGRF